MPKLLPVPLNNNTLHISTSTRSHTYSIQQISSSSITVSHSDSTSYLYRVSITLCVVIDVKSFGPNQVQMWYDEKKCLIKVCCALGGFPVSLDEFGILEDVSLYYLQVQIGLELKDLDQILRLYNMWMYFGSGFGDVCSMLICSMWNSVIWSLLIPSHHQNVQWRPILDFCHNRH